jgi:hypothetical protein
MTPTDSTFAWGEHPLPDTGDTTRIDVGPVALWVRRVKNEIRVASHHLDDGPHPDGKEPPEDADWSRWALREGSYRLRLTPALPDRMLVVKMEQPFTLLSRAEARIYTRVGAWIRIEAVSDSGSNKLTEIPTERLSDTWWGDFLAGETAYWLTTRARRELTEDLFEPWLIMCVLHLSNRSPDDLPVDKLGLRVEHLSVFEDQGRLWAEETVVAYRGEDEGSDIRMDDQPPAEAGEAREITPARTQSRGFRARTFARLKALSPFGSGG